MVVMWRTPPNLKIESSLEDDSQPMSLSDGPSLEVLPPGDRLLTSNSFGVTIWNTTSGELLQRLLVCLGDQLSWAARQHHR